MDARHPLRPTADKLLDRALADDRLSEPESELIRKAIEVVRAGTSSDKDCYLAVARAMPSEVSRVSERTREHIRRALETLR